MGWSMALLNFYFQSHLKTLHWQRRSWGKGREVVPTLSYHGAHRWARGAGATEESLGAGRWRCPGLGTYNVNGGGHPWLEKGDARGLPLQKHSGQQSPSLLSPHLEPLLGHLPTAVPTPPSPGESAVPLLDQAGNR